MYCDCNTYTIIIIIDPSKILSVQGIIRHALKGEVELKDKST